MKRVMLPDRRTPWLALGAVLLALTLLAGCGQLNDDPAQGVTVQMALDTPATATSAAQPMVAGPPASCTTTECQEVKTIVLGAVVITHRDTPYTSEDEVTNAAEDAIEDDLINSVVYFDVVQVDGVNEPVSFLIPPDTAGNWLLIAVGLRDRVTTLGEVDDLPPGSPIYFGFTFGGPDGVPRTGDIGGGAVPGATFLNGLVEPGDTLTMRLQPACSYTDNGLSTDPNSSCGAF